MPQSTARHAETDRGERRSDAILDAAEQVFASSGYKGATMREIAELAGVAQGLIHYHYKNKETLFEQLVARRSEQINGHRIALLDRLLSGPGQPDLEQIVEALFRPTIETGLDLARDGGAFARLLVSFANSSDPRDQKVLETHYDPVATRFIAAFQQVEPALTRADAVWAYMFAIGVGMTMMSKTGRPARLSDGECDDGDVEAMLARIVPFICAGVRALKT
ncbi:TetR/AcrR family transcriptional regulator [Falsiphaeobacter marinintestinus]|uniref:TetR/AcrR family transcriptional regulator n=1 Tax=Falsiphaeobacter marinintestinus TaxID=1492905 RepID=UPI001C966116|nr:TetR family transcriptional regulator [Phaeobacter marinintestinus]